MKTADLIKKSHSKRGAPGTLKRKVSGKMTIAKAKALKSRPGATTMDKKQANFFINMARARKEQQESLWANIHAKRRRGEKMRKKGEKGAPTPDQIKRAQAASESTIRDNRPDHEIMHGAHGDARKKYDAVHGHGSYHKLPADQKMKLHRKEIDQRFADRGRKPPKYTVKHTGNKVGHVGSFEIHHTRLQKVRDRLRTPTKVSEEMMTSADAGIPQDTKNMGPRLKTVNVTDRRRRKDRVPVLLKRFRKYFDDNS